MDRDDLTRYPRQELAALADRVSIAMGATVVIRQMTREDAYAVLRYWERFVARLEKAIAST